MKKFGPIAILIAALALPTTFVGKTSGDNTGAGVRVTERRGRVERFILENGLTVIIEENHFAPVSALSVWVKVGSVDETPKEAGLAHVHEHMLFKGTAKRGVGEIAQEVEGAGGDINAYTSMDETVYYITMPSKHTALGLDILGDAVFNSSFDAKELKKELEVVLEEIKRGEDNPGTKLSHEMFKAAYKVHPYGRPIIGTEESVSSFTRDDVVNFYKKWYTPDNMVLVVVGDFKSSEIMKTIETTFGAVKSPDRKKNAAPSKAYPQEQPKAEPAVTLMTGEIQEGYMDIAFNIQSVVGEDIPALEVLSYVLGAGESSRLYRAVQSDRGLVHSVYAYTYTPRDPGVLLLGTVLDGDKFAAALEAILDEAAKFKTTPVSTDELTRAKTNIESEAIYARETVQGEGRKLGFYEAIIGDVDFEDGFLRKVNAVTPEDIQRVAAKYMTPENITVAAYLPKGEAKSMPANDRVAAIAKKALNVKAENTVRETVSKFTLSNGMTLIVKENHAVPIVAMRIATMGGVRYESGDTRGINNFIARTITKGTAKRDATDIAEQTDKIAGSLGGFSGRDSIGIAGEFLSRHFDEGLDLFADVLLNPTFASKEVEQQRREIIAGIKHIEDSPDQLTIDLFRRTIYPKHPYGNRALGEIATIEKMNRQALMDYYRGLLAPQNMVIAVVGDVRAVEILPKIEKALGSLPKKEYKAPTIPTEEALDRIVKAEIVRDKEQAQIVIGFKGPSFGSDDRYALDVLSSILGGQGGRLFVDLRDKQHLAYSVGAVSVAAYEPGFFFFYIGTRPDNKDKAVAGILEHIKRIRSEVVTPEELARAREYIAGGYDVGLQTNSSQAASLSLNELYGLGWRATETYPKRIREVTAQQVLDVAKRYLSTDKYVIAVLNPKGGTGGQPQD